MNTLESKRKPGQPKKAPTTKPSLRIEAELWAAFKEKYPGKVNQMFNEWVRELTIKPTEV